MIDLHAHSTYSDGSLTPEELVDLGCEVGLTALALTDHDCTDGLARFGAACRRRKLRGVPGVEISADCTTGTLHVLGYYIDTAEPRLQEVLVLIRDGREIRNRKILEKLQGLGMELSWDDVKAFAAEEVVGRPHFAQAMVEKGYVSSKDAAFKRYLGKGKAAYVDRFRLSIKDSIAVIAGAGGLAVLAHPFTLELNAEQLRVHIAELVDCGLQGIEVYYAEHTPAQVAEYAALVKEFGLVATGGTDFHGAINPAVKLGRGSGSLHVPDEILDALEARRAALAGK